MQVTAKLQVDVERLGTENKEFQNRILALERKVRSNNIVLFGVKEGEKENSSLLEIVLNLFTDKIGVETTVKDINSVYRIGNEVENKSRPILVQFISNIKKGEIFKKAYKLKGTGLTISNDLIKTDREEQKVLYDHFKVAKGKNIDVKLRYKKLILEGKTYTYSDLKTQKDIKCIGPTYKSTQPTPSTSSTTTNIIDTDNTLASITDAVNKEKLSKRKQTNIVTRSRVK